MRHWLRSVLVLLLLGASGCSADARNPLGLGDADVGSGRAHADTALFNRAARTAWSYVETQTVPGTGLTNPIPLYHVATVWDVASGLAAIYSARELALIDAAEYHARLSHALATVSAFPLVGGAAYNREYLTTTGGIAPKQLGTETSNEGSGWSTTDLGRLLIWLRIIADNDPANAAAAKQIAGQLRMEALVQDGYLIGANRLQSGELQRYVEGRIGYEQYAAAGFALWDARAEKALRLRENALDFSIDGFHLLSDRRGEALLTSEPLVMLGLEVGWTREMAALSRNVLGVQEHRFVQTGAVTMMSEDALPIAPHYFYYYVLRPAQTRFAVVAPDGMEAVAPPWVSTKAAFGWHALTPGAYTRLAVLTVEPAEEVGAGWAAGVFEANGASTGGLNLNTAAVILEAAAYAKRGRPLILRGG